FGQPVLSDRVEFRLETARPESIGFGASRTNRISAARVHPPATVPPKRQRQSLRRGWPMWPGIRRSGAPRIAPHRQYWPIFATQAIEPRERRAWTGLYPGEPATCRRDPYHFLPILAHLGLMLGVFKVFRIEGRAFQMLVGFALASLPVHYLLPYRWKK